MGKPAARAVLDKGAHTGPITAGSADVLIGGKPAARQGDPVNCSIHAGPASIVEGSKSVLINGKPAARMGDKTSCATPPAPAPKGPEPAKDQFNFWTLAKNNNPDGTVLTKHPDNLTIKVFNAYNNLKDTNKDGTRDYVEAGFVMAEVNGKGEWTPGEGKYGKYGGGGGFSVFKAESKGTYINGNGQNVMTAEGKASVISASAEGHVGKEGLLYQKSEVKGDLLYAEGKADGQFYTGGTENKYGFQAEVSGEAGVARGEYEGQFDIPLLSVKAKGGGKVGAVGAGAKVGSYFDTDDYKANLNVGGELAAGVGLKLDVDITVDLMPLVSAIRYIFGTPMEGTIVTGCNTVIIG